MNLDLMLLIGKQFPETPFYGVRQMTWHMQNEGHAVNEKRIRRLMRLMRLMPIYQKPDTSKPAKGHKTYPYLLGGLRIDRPNQVWCADITYLPIRKGFLYLVAIMGWFTRKVLAWRISNTLEAEFCGPHSPMAVAAAGWVGLVHPEITPPSNFHHLRDPTDLPSGDPSRREVALKTGKNRGAPHALAINSKYAWPGPFPRARNPARTGPSPNPPRRSEPETAGLQRGLS